MRHKSLPIISKAWTLFLDRDGVINQEKHNDYINTWEEFSFYPGVLQAMSIVAPLFNRIIIITNQRGVGKGLTKLEDLLAIHSNLKREVEAHHGRIDDIFYCADLDDNSINRKPNKGMALQAEKRFPDINFSKSIMVGNTLSDMQFGRNIGAYTVFLPTTRPEVDLHHQHIDMVFPSLLEFAKAISNKV